MNFFENIDIVVMKYGCHINLLKRSSPFSTSISMRHIQKLQEVLQYPYAIFWHFVDIDVLYAVVVCSHVHG